MKTIQFIAQYWSQVTVIIGALGYSINHFLTYRTKKLELRFAHTMGQLSDILSKFTVAYMNIKNSIYKYSKFAQFGDQYAISKMQNEKLESLESEFSEFLKCYYLLELFADEEQLAPYHKAMLNMGIVFIDVKSTVYSKGPEGLPDEEYRKFQFRCQGKVEENTTLLKKGRDIFNKRYLNS